MHADTTGQNIKLIIHPPNSPDLGPNISFCCGERSKPEERKKSFCGDIYL